MLPDERDTIAAIASAVGPALRGVLRVAGPDAVGVVARMLRSEDSSRLTDARRPVRLGGVPIGVTLAGVDRSIAADLYVWPDRRSYSRQPSVELHLVGSPPILEATLKSLCDCGARLALPGEFTLRAVLGGRMDLTQAEAVLGVIDARGSHDLDTALAQLAGGLSSPLGRVREDLLSLLADLEAGLDFVDEEDVRFVEPQEIAGRLQQSLSHVAQAAAQAATRAATTEAPTVVLSGPPNVGKSTLFNALSQLSTDAHQQPAALVSPTPGSTRDKLTVLVTYKGRSFELIDTAGLAPSGASESIESAMQDARRDAIAQADVVLDCTPADQPTCTPTASPQPLAGQQVLRVQTKSDLGNDTPGVRCVSAKSGDGLAALLEDIGALLDEPTGSSEMVGSTAARCHEALAEAEAGLRRALPLVDEGADELVALELRTSLDGLGRVLGDVVTDDILDRIFSQFCIGK